MGIEMILIPFIGTVLGSACVIFMKKEMSSLIQQILTGFAAGVMVAVTMWGLMMPAIEQSEGMGKLSFLPAAAGFGLGILFLLILDRIIPHLHASTNEAEGPKSKFKKTTMLVLAVTLHNIPEGIAVGVVFAGCMGNNAQISIWGALSLAIGIAVQNVPEGAIVSVPLRAAGASKVKAFGYGALSGIVEPIASAFTILAAHALIPVLPYLLGFAGGAMMYVVVEELVPEMAGNKHTDAGTIAFAVGFIIMMALDVALG